MKTICTFDGTYAEFATATEFSVTEGVTTRAHAGRYVVQDDTAPGVQGRFPQICRGLSNVGATISWADTTDADVMGRAFAKDIGARYLSRAAYDKALAALKAAVIEPAEPYYRSADEDEEEEDHDDPMGLDDAFQHGRRDEDNTDWL